MVNEERAVNPLLNRKKPLQVNRTITNRPKEILLGVGLRTNCPSVLRFRPVVFKMTGRVGTPGSSAILRKADSTHNGCLVP